MTERQRELANIRNKRWKAKNPDKVRAYKRKHYLENRDKYLTIERDRQYRKRYGITLVQYNEYLEAQEGKCQICGVNRAGKKDQCFAVDHDHITGRVRGLLCIKCNSRLGWFEANKNAVEAYLGSK
jgi:Recombination endonuclease VII